MQAAGNSDIFVFDVDSNPQTTIIKEEDMNREELYFFSPSEVQYQQGNFEVVETVGNTVSIPEGSGFTVPLSDEQMNQLLLASAANGAGGGGEEVFPKMPIDFGGLFKMGGVKSEQQPLSTSHYIKYKSDENGKHVKIWECGICHKEFGHQYILMRHLPTHTDERKFQCKQCGKAFRQMSTLSQHRAIHSKLRPYVCEVCQKTFNRVSTLISHRKTHTGLKPHRCHLCNKAFHQKGNLRNHIFTHTNERPYKCDVCHKGFNQMSNLMCHKFKAHQRDDKPRYNCQTCGKEFEKRIGLRNHEQYEHGESNASSTIVNVPSVKYTNGVLVAPINTAAMKHAVATNQVPFALLRPLNGIPVLVRVLPAGDRQMLVPATAEDLKKFGEITIKKKDEGGDESKEAGDENNVCGNLEAKISPSSSDAVENTAVISGTTSDDKKAGATVQIRIPVVASVVQRCRDGAMHMDIESPGPRREGHDDSFIFTTTDEEFSKQQVPWQGAEVKSESDTSTSPSSAGQAQAQACDEDAAAVQYFDIESFNNGGPPKNKIMLQKDFALDQNGVQLFEGDEMELDISGPIIDLTNDQGSIVLGEILPTEIFNTDPNNEIYEVSSYVDMDEFFLID